MFKDTIDFIKELYNNRSPLGLHEPILSGNEVKYVNNAIHSTYVSSIGQYVEQFEKEFATYVKAPYAVVTSNGTSALHIALKLLNVGPNDEVLTQALTFVATANAISYCSAQPVFIDSDRQNLGMSLESLQRFLSEETSMVENICVNKRTGRVIKVCVPMHVFGHPVRIDEITELCARYNIEVLEDAAESLGSLYKNQHTGLFGKLGIFSFNGNKIVTTGGGGMIVTRDANLALRAKHLSTTAKVPHKWGFFHDEVGYNYRMPNLNAALGCAQLERIEEFVENKRETAKRYEEFFSKKGIQYVSEPEHSRSNYWLNSIILKDRRERDLFLEETNMSSVLTRPAWELMPDLPMYKKCQSVDLTNAHWISDRLVNLPSSVRW